MQERRKSIAFVAHSHYPRDPRVRRQARALAGAGWEVHVFCLRGAGERRREEIDGIHVRRLPVDRHRGAPLAVYLAEYAAFCVLVTGLLFVGHLRRRFGVVEIANPPDFLILAALLPRLLGARVVFDVHDNSLELARSRFGVSQASLLYRSMALWERIAFRVAHLVLSPDAGQQERLLQRGLPEDKARLVFNSADESIFDAVRETALPAPGFSVICHRTIIRRYGADLLVRAAAQVRERIPGLRIHLFGDGDFLPEIRALRSDLGLQDVVEIHGFRPVEEIASCLGRAHACVIPTRRDEFTDLSLPTRLFEATALGVPCIVARTSTTLRYFAEDAAAFFDSGDVNELCGCLERLADDPALRSSLVKRARDAAAPLRWSVQKHRYVEMLSS